MVQNVRAGDRGRSEHWTETDLKPYIDHVLACFGFDRVMFGGDWPVVLTQQARCDPLAGRQMTSAGLYRRSHQVTETVSGDMTASHFIGWQRIP